MRVVWVTETFMRQSLLLLLLGCHDHRRADHRHQPPGLGLVAQVAGRDVLRDDLDPVLDVFQERLQALLQHLVDGGVTQPGLQQPERADRQIALADPRRPTATGPAIPSSAPIAVSRQKRIDCGKNGFSSRNSMTRAGSIRSA